MVQAPDPRAVSTLPCTAPTAPRGGSDEPPLYPQPQPHHHQSPDLRCRYDLMPALPYPPGATTGTVSLWPASSARSGRPKCDHVAWSAGRFDHGGAIRSIRACAMVLPGSPAAKQRTRLRPRPATTRHRPGFPGTLYRPRRPTQTALYQAVQHHLETFVARAAESDAMGYGLPDWVERDFRGYLGCGILAHGFAKARCEGCGHERLIPLECCSYYASSVRAVVSGWSGPLRGPGSSYKKRLLSSTRWHRISRVPSRRRLFTVCVCTPSVSATSFRVRNPLSRSRFRRLSSP